MVSRSLQQVTVICLAAFLLGMIFISQWQSDLDLDRFRAGLESQNRVLNLLPSSTIQKLNLGFNHASADYLWLKTIQYFGGGNANQQYQSLYGLIDNVINLDPGFEYPYLFGGIVLPWQGQPKEALNLLDRGAAEFPDNGLFPYDAGSIARINLKDSTLAAKYFQQAVGKENTPPAATILAGVNLSELSDRAFAITWFNSILETEKNPAIIERATAWRDHLILVSDLENTISQAEADGHQIKQLQDLVTYGYLSSIPISPLKVSLTYNQQTHQVEIIRK